MSASTIDIVRTNDEGHGRWNESVRRSALYLPAQGESIFGWLHQPSESRSLDHGVLICAPIGYEQLHSHRSLRHLADSLARQRIPTLRFDWHGTGDSPGVDHDPSRIATWLSNIRDAAQWMRQELGCQQISLVGLRIGATLATLATQETEVDHLVLWAPVIKGRAYVREMKALSLTSDAPPRPTPADSNDIEAAGFTLSSGTAAELGPIDLHRLTPKCQSVLVAKREDLSDDDRLWKQWTDRGVDVQQITFSGFGEMMADPHRSEVPHRAIQQISDWIGQSIFTTSQTIVGHRAPVGATTLSLSIRARAGEASPTGSQDPIRESTFVISTDPDLFGIVSEPTTSVVETRPLIVLLNSGSAHRVAPGRMNVLIARRLASLGFCCLRLDLNGLGDSVLEGADSENDSYPATAFRDIELTLKQLEQRLGARRFVLMGLCSGAYAAFQSAAQIPNPALVESILINPLTYFWEEGMTLDDSPTKHLTSFHYYKSVACDPQKWIKLLSGKSKTGLFGAVKVVGRRLGLLKDRRSAQRPKPQRKKRPAGISHPEHEDLAGDLKRVADRNRRLAMFFSRTDPGFGILNYHARRKANELRANGRLTIKFIEDADHTFTRSAARTDLIDAIAGYLCNRY